MLFCKCEGFIILKHIKLSIALSLYLPPSKLSLGIQNNKNIKAKYVTLHVPKRSIIAENFRICFLFKCGVLYK